ncbi:MAG TPA: hypothetical protein VGN17_00365 [Bryobacteraceae bacterium]|jgi:hypothetical protein
MANLISAQTGNFTSSSTWQTVDSTSELDSEAGSTAVSTSNLDSSTFVPTAITVDGVALKFSARAASPTGTFTVTLRDSTTSTDVDSVTVNVSDLPAPPGNCWIFFKFGSTHTLSGTDSYLIRVACSNTGSQVILFRNATSNNWSRKLRTTTTQAPAANNHLVISNQFTGAGTSTAVTVTMDNTASTTWGPSSVGTQGVVVGGNGTLTFGTSSSTNYNFTWRGYFLISGGGTVNVGTSGTRIPSSSSVTLQMDSASNGDSFLKPDAGGTLNIYGASKTGYSYLTADAASSATSVTVNDTTGWQNSDVLAFSPTDTNRTHYESKSVASSGGISGSTVTLASGLGVAHSGTGILAAFVLNLTRNVTLSSKSTSNKGNLWVPAAGGTVYIECCQFDGSTMGSNSANLRPVDLQMTTNTVTLKNCAFQQSTTGSQSNTNLIHISGGTANNCTLDTLVIYDWISNMVTVNTKTSGSSIVINNCIGMNQENNGGSTFGIASANVTVTNNISISASALNNGPGISYYNSDLSSWTMTDPTKFSGNQVWYAENEGFGFGSSANGSGFSIAIQNCIAARCQRSGFDFGGVFFRSAIMDNCKSFGNGVAGAGYNVYVSANACAYLEIRNSLLASDTAYTSTVGIMGPYTNFNGGGNFIVRLYNCTLGVATGIYTTHATADMYMVFPNQMNMQVYADKTAFGSSTLLFNLTDANQQLNDGGIDLASSFVRCQDYGQTSGDHRSFFPQGNIKIDSSVYHTSAPSQKLTPSQASYKLRSGVQQASVSNGVGRNVSVWVRKSKASTGDSADYNGNQPRLFVRRNDALGITSDTVLTTASSAIGNWEQLTGTAVASPPEDGAVEMWVDCDGTTGFISVDDWSIS